MLALAVLVLLVLGVLMLLSTGRFGSEGADLGDRHGPLRRHLTWMAVGAGAGLAGALAPLTGWRRMAGPGIIVAMLCLVLCFVPGIGREWNGDRRWVEVWGLRSQPSEWAKIALALGMASCLGDRSRWVRAGVLAVVLAALVLWQSDLGTAAVLGSMTLAMFQVAGASRWGMAAGAGLSGVAVAAWLWAGPGLPERAREIWPGGGEASAQTVAQVALGSGGWEGLGLGAGRMKMLYMTSAHTDFVLPMIGEELGLPATLLVSGCFAALALAGLRIAARAADGFARVLGVGLVVALAGQGALNLAVSTGCWADTGVPMPFVSYGGSNLVMSWLAVGLIVNVARESGRRRPEEPWWRQQPVVES